MADRLARLGPHDGPSPALDAKILAAAHAAVAPRRNRRWLALSGIPATLVTGAGMAAVLALAVGVVWQLRPSAPAARAPRGEGDDFGYVTAEVIKRAEPTATVAPPPPPPPAEAAATARAVPAPSARRDVAPSRAEAMTAKQPAAPAQDHYLDEAVDPANAHPAQTAAAPAGRSDAEPRAFSYSEPAAPAPAAAMPAPAAAPAVAAEGEQRQRMAAEADAAARSKAVANDAAKQARSRELRSQTAAVAAAEAGGVATDAAASDSTLDRVEVTGSRGRMTEQPVRNDRELAPDQWLQRIRERRDSGDLDGARQSLALFRKANPRLRLPDDLRALADSTR